MTEELFRLIEEFKKEGTASISKIIKIVPYELFDEFITMCMQEGIQIIDDEFEISDPNEMYNHKLNDAVTAYFNEIKNFPVLSYEETVHLTKTMRNESIPLQEREKARKRMTECNLKLVVSIAKHYSHINHKDSFMDIIQSGNLGLIKAIELYDPDKGFMFSTYATWWIKQSITRFFLETNTSIRIPTHRLHVINVVNQEYSRLYSTTGKFPGVEELAKKLNLTEEQVQQALFNPTEILSLNTPIGGDEEDFTLLDCVSENEEIDLNRVISKICVDSIFEKARRSNKLSPREEDILKKRFGFYDHEYSLEEIGTQYNLTRERIRQIEQEALIKLRNVAKV